MTALLIIACIAGAIWWTILALRGSLVAGCLIFLIGTACLGEYFFEFKVAGVTLSLARLWLVGLIGAFFVQW